MLALTQKSIFGGNSVFSFGIAARVLLNNCNRDMLLYLPSIYNKDVSKCQDDKRMQKQT